MTELLLGAASSWAQQLCLGSETLRPGLQPGAGAGAGAGVGAGGGRHQQEEEQGQGRGHDWGLGLRGHTM